MQEKVNLKINYSFSCISINELAAVFENVLLSGIVLQCFKHCSERLISYAFT